MNALPLSSIARRPSSPLYIMIWLRPKGATTRATSPAATRHSLRLRDSQRLEGAVSITRGAEGTPGLTRPSGATTERLEGAVSITRGAEGTPG